MDLNESKFSKFFTTYEATDPPPVITLEYKAILDLFNSFIYPESSKKVALDLTSKDPLESNLFSFFSNYKIPAATNYHNAAVETARQYLGSNYQWGGSSPTTGFDCSGLIQYAYAQLGISLPRTVKELESYGTEVSLDSVLPGDLICTPGSGASGKHVKMVSKIENGLIFTIESKGKKDGVIESPLTRTDNIVTIRRV